MESGQLKINPIFLKIDGISIIGSQIQTIIIMALIDMANNFETGWTKRVIERSDAYTFKIKLKNNKLIREVNTSCDNYTILILGQHTELSITEKPDVIKILSNQWLECSSKLIIIFEAMFYLNNEFKSDFSKELVTLLHEAPKQIKDLITIQVTS